MIVEWAEIGGCLPDAQLEIVVQRSIPLGKIFVRIASDRSTKSSAKLGDSKKDLGGRVVGSGQRKS